MSTRKRLSSICIQTLKQRFASAEEALGLPQYEYFSGWEDRPPPKFSNTSFDANEAWWMAELCHLAYTPDSKEFTRVWNANKPNRLEISNQKTPFHEILDVHKTGNHAAIYEIESGEGGTVLCFRGTCKPVQWIANLTFHRHEWARFCDNEDFSGGLVHSGFYVAFKRIWPLIWPTLRLAPRPWIFTGHSLGGALAMLANAVAKADKVYTFGSPRLGNEKFASSFFDNTIRIVNDQDIVPLLPSRGPVRKNSERIFDHGGELIWLTESGQLNQDSSSHITKQPWDPLEAWGKESDEIFQRLPPWLADHFISRYCQKIAKIT